MVISPCTSKDNCQIFISVFFFFFGVSDVLFYSIYSIISCLHSRFKRLMRDACVSLPPPSSAWRTADKKATKSSGPKPHWHRHSEEGMLRSSLPDEPGMLPGLIFNSLSNQNSRATSARWAPGCQISILVFGAPQNRLKMFPPRSESRLTCLDPKVIRDLSCSRWTFRSSEDGRSDAIFNLLSIFPQGGLFILRRLCCTFVFYINLLKIKFCPLMQWWRHWFTTVDGTKRNRKLMNDGRGKKKVWTLEGNEKRLKSFRNIYTESTDQQF